MNNLNPLVPQGSNLEQKIKGRSRVKLAVFFVLAAHVVFLGPLLMQGCKPQQPTSSASQTNPPALLEPVPELPAYTNTSVGVLTPPDHTNPPPQLPTTGTTEYIVVKNDSFYSLSKKFGVSMKAIADANPGVDSAKMKIGQPLHIPAPIPAPTAPSGNGLAATAAESGPYSVKSGDTLSKIAAAHGTTVKAIRTVNNLKTDQIKVGQKLKLPEPKAAAPAPAGSPSQPATPPAAVPPGN